MSTPSTLEVNGVGAAYSDVEVLKAVSFRVDAGGLLTLVGPSGSGKSTVLKTIAGLLAPTRGDILFDGQSMRGVAAERRHIAMVFQKPLLFPYLDVAGNVGFGLKMRRLSRAEVEARVEKALALVQLDGFERRKSGELSGGQEQRVALARALVTEPRILLLDEPFSALDERLRAGMRMLVRDLQQSLGITTVFVTHDQQEAVEISDYIGVLMDGSLHQLGPARIFYEKPATRRVAEFFGWQPLPGTDEMFRPERARLGVPRDGEAHCETTVRALIDLGIRRIYRVAGPGGEIVEVNATDDCLYAAGANVTLCVSRSHLVTLY